MDTDNFKVGVDIGGSHITVGLVNLKTKRLIKDTLIRKSVDSHGCCDSIIREWTSTINQLFSSGISVNGIGIAMPGPFDYKNGVSLMQNQNKYDSLYGLNIKERLASSLVLNSEQIIMMNDASCFLLGEIYSGSMEGFNNVIGITLGTGLGSAHYIDGKIKDANLWEMPFMGGIAEDFISTRWFVKKWKEYTNEEVKGVKEIIETVIYKEELEVLFDEFSENLSKFLYAFIKKKRPSALVLGGNIVRADTLFLRQTQKR